MCNTFWYHGAGALTDCLSCGSDNGVPPDSARENPRKEKTFYLKQIVKMAIVTSFVLDYV